MALAIAIDRGDRRPGTELGRHFLGERLAETGRQSGVGGDLERIDIDVGAGWLAKAQRSARQPPADAEQHGQRSDDCQHPWPPRRAKP